MNRMVLAMGGVAAAVAITLLAVGMYIGLNVRSPGVGGVPTPTVAPSPGPTDPEGVLYTSARHGYSLLLPDDTWAVEELPGVWPLGDTFNQEGPGADSISSGPGPLFLINSQAVPAGTDFEQWIADHEAAKKLWFPCTLIQSETGVIGGEAATIHSYSCGTERATEAVTFHGGRAYAIRVGASQSNPALDPRPILDDWITRFTFTD